MNSNEFLLELHGVSLEALVLILKENEGFNMEHTASLV